MPVKKVVSVNLVMWHPTMKAQSQLQSAQVSTGFVRLMTFSNHSKNNSQSQPMCYYQGFMSVSFLGKAAVTQIPYQLSLIYTTTVKIQFVTIFPQQNEIPPLRNQECVPAVNL